jgi:hypothetical protein
MNDKSKELNTSVKLINNRLNFSGFTNGNDPVSIDYTPPLGDNLGYTSLELLLLSLSEDKYCPVYSMIKGNVDVEISYSIRVKS